MCDNDFNREYMVPDLQKVNTKLLLQMYSSWKFFTVSLNTKWQKYAANDKVYFTLDDEPIVIPHMLILSEEFLQPMTHFHHGK